MAKAHAAIRPRSPGGQADDRLLSAIVDRLRPLGPDWIVLFGSRARGDAAEASDLDLLVVKPGADRAELRSEALGLLRGLGVLVDVHAYGSDEFLQRLLAGDPIVREALLEGKVIYRSDAVMGREDVVEEWVVWAEKDWAIVQALDPVEHPEGVAYHAQQCVEKYLKALLISRSVRPERTHDLGHLLDQAPDAVLRELAPEVEWLTDFATRRYPGPSVSLDEARRALNVAVRLRAAVRDLLA